MSHDAAVMLTAVLVDVRSFAVAVLLRP